MGYLCKESEKKLQRRGALYCLKADFKKVGATRLRFADIMRAMWLLCGMKHSDTL